MIDLFPAEAVELLEERFGEAYKVLPHFERVALIIALVEDTVTHERLCALGDQHPSDASQSLRHLLAEDFLEQTGSSRGAVYHIKGVTIPGPEDVFDSPNLERSSLIRKLSSPINEDSSPISDKSSSTSKRDENGCLLSKEHHFPFVDDLHQLTPSFLEKLEKLANEPRQKKRLSPEKMKEVILSLAEDKYITISCLAVLVNREVESLRQLYLTQMVRENSLTIAFPRTPNDPRQAYTKA